MDAKSRVIVQKMNRERQRLADMKRAEEAASVIQAHWKGFVARKKWIRFTKGMKKLQELQRY